MIRRVTLIVAAWLLWLPVALSAPPETLTGKVVSITGGDTLTVLVEKVQHKIRVEGIDCPERKQPYGTKAKQFTGSLAFGKVVTVRVSTRDRYGRLVARVAVPDGKDLSAELVKAGFAWHYKRYSKDKQLAALEVEARKARVGLWVDAKPIPPWEWRRAKRGKGKADKPPADGSGGYWLTSSSGVRHNSTCRWYRKSKGRQCGPNEGKPCGVCGG